MSDRDAVRPEHGSDVPSRASSSTPQAPDEAIVGSETGNDPTAGTMWTRRRFRLRTTDGADDALAAVLEVPGVARAALEPGSRELVADIEPGVVSDDELAAAVGRGGSEPHGWHDETIPRREGAGDVGPVDDTSAPDRDRDTVAEESEESFPASDPPSSWARSADDDGA
jgi:hypothetical protein